MTEDITIYVTKFSFHDQYTSDEAITGIFTNLALALQKAEKDGGYTTVYRVIPNSVPMKLERI